MEDLYYMITYTELTISVLISDLILYSLTLLKALDNEGLLKHYCTENEKEIRLGIIKAYSLFYIALLPPAFLLTYFCEYMVD